jgi:serine/threonine protein kinase
MPASSSCPDLTQLERLLLGQTPASETELLEAHVTGCPACSAALSRARAVDPLVEAITDPKPLYSEADRGLVAELIGRLKALPAAPPAPAPGPRDRDTPSARLASETLPMSAPDPSARERHAFLAPSQAADEIGRLGPYRVRRVLGRGGMGMVFLAEDPRLKRPVALKVLLEARYTEAHYVARFRGEAETVARLRHPHIVQIHEVGTHEGRPYLALEHVEGGNLAERLAGRPQPARAAAALVETLARALHYAHEQGVIHRDLKPANILMERKSEIPNPRSERIDSDFGFRISDLEPKVTDFGLAKRLDEKGLTQTGDLLGTPGYLAPELTHGRARGGDCGPTVDVYGLGAILYELLTGRPPFRGETVLDTLEQVRALEPVPVRRLQPKVPRDLETVCLKCLDKEPGRRYASAGDLAADLGRLLHGEPIRARPVSLALRLAKWVRRKPALAALAAVSSLALVALVAGGLVYNAWLQKAVDRAEAGETRARKQQQRADTGYRAARDALDRMLGHLERRQIGEVPQLKELERRQCEDALAFYGGILAGADDPDPEVRLDAARAYKRTAQIQALLDHFPEARRSLGRAIDLLESLPAALHDRPEAQDLLAACYGDRGFMAARPDDRERGIRKGLAIRERLARARPNDPARQNAVALCEHQLAHVFINAGRWADAERHCERAVAIRTRLVRHHPQKESYQEELAGDYVNLGVIYGSTKRRDIFDVYEKVGALLRPLIARHPDDFQKRLVLASVEVNQGLDLRGQGKPRAALRQCTEAVNLAEAALWREPHYVTARATALNAHGARAQTYEALGRWADAAKDWDRVVELDGGTHRWVHRALRAMDLASAGDYARATAEADALAADGKAVGEGAWGLAITYARSLRAVRSASGLRPAERDALTDRYAARAMALLGKLQSQGYFKDQVHAKALRTENDLKPLRGRDDFRQLLGQVAAFFATG